MLCALASLGLPLAGGCAPSVEADVNRLEITWPALQFPAVPADLAGPVSLDRGFDLDSSSAAWAKQLNANVQALQVRLHAADGATNLAFIQNARVTMTGSDAKAATEVMSFARTAGTPAGADIVVENPQPIDVTQVWSSPSVRVDVAVSGTPPTHAWSMSVTIDLSGTLSYAL